LVGGGSAADPALLYVLAFPALIFNFGRQGGVECRIGAAGFDQLGDSTTQFATLIRVRCEAEEPQFELVEFEPLAPADAL